MRGELILPGNSGNTAPDIIYIVNDKGREVEVPREDLWLHRSDAYSGEAEIHDMADLPKTEWMKEGEKNG